MRRARWRMSLAAVAAAVIVAAGCGVGGNVAGGDLVIYTTPGLADTLGGLTHAFTSTYPAVRLQTIVEPDGQMPGRIAQGPAPDLITAEDPATLKAAGVSDAPVHFAQGQLVIAVRADDSAPVTDLTDLARPGARIALCAAEQPCGAVAAAVLATANVGLTDATYESDVQAALADLTNGTADAALVYRFTAAAAGDAVHTVEIPQSSTRRADLVAVIPSGARNAGVAKTFLDYLASEPVRETLVARGFSPPLS